MVTPRLFIKCRPIEREAVVRAVEQAIDTALDLPPFGGPDQFHADRRYAGGIEGIAITNVKSRGTGGNSGIFRHAHDGHAQDMSAAIRSHLALSLVAVISSS